MDKLEKSSSAGNYYWFPVLELVDKSTVTLGLEDIHGAVDYSLQPCSVSAENTFSLKPLVLGNPDTTDFEPVVVTSENSFALHPPALMLPKTVDFQPIAAAAEMYTPPDKTSLTSLNGELDGFKQRYHPCLLLCVGKIQT